MATKPRAKQVPKNRGVALTSAATLPDPLDVIERKTKVVQPEIKKLLRDDLFISKYVKVANQLRVALNKNSSYVRRFFTTFGTLLQANPEKVDKFIERTDDLAIRDALHSYLRLCSRFQVALCLRKDRFKLVSL
jgi:hypothetical protein